MNRVNSQRVLMILVVEKPWHSRLFKDNKLQDFQNRSQHRCRCAEPVAGWPKPLLPTSVRGSPRWWFAKTDARLPNPLVLPPLFATYSCPYLDISLVSTYWILASENKKHRKNIKVQDVQRHHRIPMISFHTKLGHFSMLYLRGSFHISDSFWNVSNSDKIF